MLIVVLAMLLEVMLNLVKMGASTALAARSGWSIWPGMPGQFAPEWGGQFDAESLVTFRRNWVVNISGISTINNALKNFKVNDFNYIKPSPKNVITFQNKPTAEFYNEVIQDLIDGLNANSEINNKKATNLLHSYKSFKLANLIMAVLVAFFCLTIFFFKAKQSKVTVSGTVKVEHLDSAMTEILNTIKIQNELLRTAIQKDTFKISPVIKKNKNLKHNNVSLNSKVK
jgi:predicted S18 family serine protease